MFSKEKWEPVILQNGNWTWEGNCLFHNSAGREVTTSIATGSLLSRLIVKFIYGRQNRASPVQKLVNLALSRLDNESLAVSFGSGHERLSPLVANLDLSCGENIDIVMAGDTLPFKENSLDLVISQEVFEHLKNPFEVIEQIRSVLKKGGYFVFQVPFVIGYHPDPFDYWRFTQDSFDVLFPETKWKIIEREISVGHGTAFYRILVEFVAVNFSIIGKHAYKISKGIGALIFSPIILFDIFTSRLPEKDRIPGGYIIMIRKV